MDGAPARTYPCCMCPAVYANFEARVCTNCGFIREFFDDRGRRYYVRAGIGRGTYKTFVRGPGGKEYCCGALLWRNSFSEAQTDLNKLGWRKGWREKRKE